MERESERDTGWVYGRREGRDMGEGGGVGGQEINVTIWPCTLVPYFIVHSSHPTTVNMNGLIQRS